MICFMHEGNPYGHLKVGNKVILSPNLASMVGATLKDVIDWLEELHQAGVYELGENGTIYSKRMVRDEILRNKRAEGGKLGGNPALKVNHGDNHEVEIEDKQKPTPSSSSSFSSSSSSNLIGTNVPICPPDGELADKKGKKLPGCNHQAVIDLYHEHLPTMRRIEVWNDQRAGYLRQRWREVASELSQEGEITAKDVLGWWGEFFQHIDKSKFLTGKVNSKDGRAFTADLEWIVKPNNFAKIVEGKYHGNN
jgi:hypothetical protein